MGGVSPEPGRPPGLQQRVAPYQGQPGPHRQVREPYCSVLQPLLRRHGSHWRLVWRQVLPQMGYHPEYPFLERRNHVHGPCKRSFPAYSYPFHSHWRRRGLLRPRKLLPPGPVPYGYPRQGHVHPPDIVLRRSNPGRLAGRIHRGPPWLAVRLLHFWRRGRNLGRGNGREAEGSAKE